MPLHPTTPLNKCAGGGRHALKILLRLDDLDLVFPTGYRNTVFVMEEGSFRELYLRLSGQDAGFLDRGCNFIAEPKGIRSRRSACLSARFVNLTER